MKATQRDFNAVAPKAARQVRVFFFCGPDEAGAASALARVVTMLDDPGERVDMSGSDLRSDPVRLGDEARSNSLFAGSRHIVVRAAGDEAHDAVKILLEAIDSGEAASACPVLIAGTGATDKSRTAKLLESRADGLVAMFYPPDLKSVTEEVTRMAGAAGLRLGGGLAERIARSSSLDVRLAQSEVTKLATYLDASAQSPCLVEEQALDDIGAKTEEDTFMPLVNAVLSGEVNRLPGEIHRLRELSLNPVAVLLAVERRAAQLAQLCGKAGPGGRINDTLEAEQKARRIFWRDRRDLASQMQSWNAPRLDRLLQRLAALHRNILANSQSAELMLVQELTEIAHHASPKRRAGAPR